MVEMARVGLFNGWLRHISYKAAAAKLEWSCYKCVRLEQTVNCHSEVYLPDELFVCYMLQALPSVQTLQCPTGRLDKNKNRVVGT